MAINKIIDRNGNSILDLSTDDLDSDTSKVLQGCKYHGKDGKVYIGSLEKPKVGETDDTVKFIDWDGEVLYEYTLEEAQALTELPEYPNLEKLDAINAKFDGWNWTLDELKSVEEDDYAVPVIGAQCSSKDGAIYITKDFIGGKNYEFAFSWSSYCTVFNQYNNSSNVKVFEHLLSIDWGDGTTSTSTADQEIFQKTYDTTGEYCVRISYEITEILCRVGDQHPTQGTITNISFNNPMYLDKNYLSIDKFTDGKIPPTKLIVLPKDIKEMVKNNDIFEAGWNGSFYLGSTSGGTSTFFNIASDVQYCCSVDNMINPTFLMKGTTYFGFRLKNFNLIVDRDFVSFMNTGSLSASYSFTVNKISLPFSMDLGSRTGSTKVYPWYGMNTLMKQYAFNNTQHLWFPRLFGDNIYFDYIYLPLRSFKNKGTVNIKKISFYPTKRLESITVHDDIIPSIVSGNGEPALQYLDTSLDSGSIYISTSGSGPALNKNLYLKIKSTVNSRTSYLFSLNYAVSNLALLELDLTSNENFIEYTGSTTGSPIFSNTSHNSVLTDKEIRFDFKIYVRRDHLEQYKNSNGWKWYKNYFVGVDVE